MRSRRALLQLARQLNSSNSRSNTICSRGARPAPFACNSTTDQQHALNTAVPQLRHASTAPCAPPFSAGQPIFQTHPHLLAEGELTPGITAAEYAARRERLCAALPPGSVVIVQAALPQFMAGIIPYPYRQSADFYYLTGLNQLGVAVLQTDSSPQGGSKHRYTLFVEPPSFEKARWDGTRVDLEAARCVFGADEAYYTTQLRRHLLDKLLHAPAVVHSSNSLAYSKDVQWAISEAGQGSSSTQTAQQQRFIPLTPVMHAMRMRKSPAEVRLMVASADLSANALKRCMALTRPGELERTLATTFEYECKLRGAERMSFPSVVASGPDSCTIHYLRNDKVLREGQLVKMDAGCELHGYVSDVTRTWPINGRFSSPQRDVYTAVQEVHARCHDACKPGSSIRELHQLSVRLISEALKELRLVPQGLSADAVASQHANTFYWHSLGHMVGLDTHDVATMGFDRTLLPGCCLTIEPGMYIPDEERFGALRGIGVRIEDDVLVTEQGCKVLSGAVPVGVHEVEALVGQG